MPDPTLPSEEELRELELLNAAMMQRDQARGCVSRFNASHWNNPGEHARYSIPADPTRDDDLLLGAYIDGVEQLRQALPSLIAAARQRAAGIEAARRLIELTDDSSAMSAVGLRVAAQAVLDRLTGAKP